MGEPALPLAWSRNRPRRLDPPRIVEHTDEELARAGLGLGEIDELTGRGVAIRALDPAFPRS